LFFENCLQFVRFQSNRPEKSQNSYANILCFCFSGNDFLINPLLTLRFLSTYVLLFNQKTIKIKLINSNKKGLSYLRENDKSQQCPLSNFCWVFIFKKVLIEAKIFLLRLNNATWQITKCSRIRESWHFKTTSKYIYCINIYNNHKTGYVS
jgi:hypothetical protein